MSQSTGYERAKAGDTAGQKPLYSNELIDRVKFPTIEMTPADVKNLFTQGLQFAGFSLLTVATDGIGDALVGGGVGTSTAISMDEAVDMAAAHVDGAGVTEETGKGLNYQFRNTYVDAQGNTVSKMGRFDINPADPKVAARGPHLNIETHINGKQWSNVHINIDPATIRMFDHP